MKRNPDEKWPKPISKCVSRHYIYRIKAVAGIGSACGPGARPTPGLRGGRPAMYHVHVNTAGLHASAAMGLSGRLEFDSSNHGLC
jgi:hypothetical protein